MTPHQPKISNEELMQLIKDGRFFYFCVSFALNKGFKNVLKGMGEVRFSVGDYDVTFNHKQGCFVLVHKIYFAQMITAYLNEVVFIGHSEEEVINDLLTEFKKELL